MKEKKKPTKVKLYSAYNSEDDGRHESVGTDFYFTVLRYVISIQHAF